MIFTSGTNGGKVEIVHVHIQVVDGKTDEFIRATLDNVHNSLLEEGIVRFDFMQQADDPLRFVLIEMYHNPEAQAAHKETAHYKKWRDIVAPMMAEPRVGVKYTALLPKTFEK